ncbi:MAG: amidohydrolase [Candidatus Omnitrophica bacterium]|jgi:predicted TIM-barrel fold metal-dependent hydrolase|nr:amidohydrolase [Candidatus Omnitrophota bacterium]
MICDSHIHFIPQEISENTSFYKGIWSDKVRLFEFLDVNKINKALLVYPATDAHVKLGWQKLCELYNFFLAALVEENPKIIGFGIVDLSSNISAQVKHLREEGFKGISIPSSQDGAFILDKLKPLFEAAEKHKLAIFVHPQTINPIGFERVKDPLLMPVLEYSFDSSMFLGALMMEGILEKFNVNFIFSSLGGVVPFLKDRFDRVYMMLRSRDMVKDLGKPPSEILKKVYVDTSGSSLANIKLAIDLFGEDKILWGSDYPVNANIPENLNILQDLDINTKNKILKENFISLFK